MRVWSGFVVFVPLVADVSLVCGARPRSATVNTGKFANPASCSAGQLSSGPSMLQKYASRSPDVQNQVDQRKPNKLQANHMRSSKAAHENEKNDARFFSLHDGFISDGGDLLRVNATVAKARRICGNYKGKCRGFTHKGPPTVDGVVEIMFKSKWENRVPEMWTSYQLTSDPLHPFVHYDGYISSGGDLEISRVTPQIARSKCKALDRCKGFTFEGPPTDSVVTVMFKDHWNNGVPERWTSYRYDKAEEEDRRASKVEEDQARKKAIEEAKRKAFEVEAKRKADEQEAMRKQIEEVESKIEEKIKVAEEEKRRADEIEAKREADEVEIKNKVQQSREALEEAQRKADEMKAKRRADEEEAIRKQVEEAKRKAEEARTAMEEARRRTDEVKAQKEAKEGEAIEKKVEEAKGEAEEKRNVIEESKRKMDEEVKNKAAEELPKWTAAQEAEASKAAEEAKRKEDEEEARSAVETNTKRNASEKPIKQEVAVTRGQIVGEAKRIDKQEVERKASGVSRRNGVVPEIAAPTSHKAENNKGHETAKQVAKNNKQTKKVFTPAKILKGKNEAGTKRAKLGNNTKNPAEVKNETKKTVVHRTELRKEDLNRIKMM